MVDTFLKSFFERKSLSDGTKNPKYVDVLDEDEGIAGQKFACMSFISPEKILEKRELYLFDQFINYFYRPVVHYLVCTCYCADGNWI